MPFILSFVQASNTFGSAANFASSFSVDFICCNTLIMCFCNFKIILFVLFHLINATCCVSKSLHSSSPPCPVFLTISALSRHTDESHLELNWGPDCPNPPELINLYEEDPSISDTLPLVTIRTENEASGHFRTSIKLGKLNLPGGWNPDEAMENPPRRIRSMCLPFHVTSVKENERQMLNCLKIQPNWMSSEPLIGSIPLRALFLPGTHCSGCFHGRTYTKSILLKRFGYVQNFDVWTQLVFGIRYLDFSIGYHDNKHSPDDLRNFWIVNDSFFITSLLPILKEIRKFVLLSGEMVVIDFGDFPIGFYNYPERHVEFIKLLGQELGDIAFTKHLSDTRNSGDLTLDVMRQKEKYILITYNEQNHTKDSDLVWPSWRKFNTIHLKSTELKNYMQTIFSKEFENSPQNASWVLFGIQGVDASYSPGLHLPSARERANSINRNVSNWLSGIWGLSANVVALDYFCGSNLIDIAVSANLQKRSNNSDYIIIQINE